MVEFSLSLFFTAIWVIILTGVGLFALITGITENPLEVAATTPFFFLPSLILASAFMGELIKEKDKIDKGEVSDFKGTTMFLSILLVLALCIGAVEAVWPGFLSAAVVAASGGSLAILALMVSFFLIVDGSTVLKVKVHLISGWMVVVSTILYLLFSIGNARGVSFPHDGLTILKSTISILSIINLCFLWTAMKQKSEVSETKVFEDQALEEEIVPKEEEE